VLMLLPLVAMGGRAGPGVRLRGSAGPVAAHRRPATDNADRELTPGVVTLSPRHCAGLPCGVIRQREWTFICLVVDNVECVRCHRSCGPADSPAWHRRGPPAGLTCDDCANALEARLVWGDVDRFGLDS
jgi:hypothetical protein